MNIKERVINGLYGQAVADSVGNPFEFKSLIDPSDVSYYASESDVLYISDDTQMALFGFSAIQKLKKMHGYIDDDIVQSFKESYIEWFYTQTNTIRSNAGLLSFASMYNIEAPGSTCLLSLKILKNGGKVVNSSIGCGSVMRLLPTVLLIEEYLECNVIEFAKSTGGITHKHPDNDIAIERYMTTAFNLLKDKPVDYINVDRISSLGLGWTAIECVNMAIWAYAKARTFDELLELSIAHNGDSDSVGAVAGSLWGLSGKEVPIKYINKLNALDAIKWVENELIQKI